MFLSPAPFTGTESSREESRFRAHPYRSTHTLAPIEWVRSFLQYTRSVVSYALKRDAPFGLQ